MRVGGEQMEGDKGVSQSVHHLQWWSMASRWWSTLNRMGFGGAGGGGGGGRGCSIMPPSSLMLC